MYNILIIIVVENKVSFNVLYITQFELIRDINFIRSLLPNRDKHEKNI